MLPCAVSRSFLPSSSTFVKRWQPNITLLELTRYLRMKCSTLLISLLPLSISVLFVLVISFDVLVCPKRELKRVADLTADETCDLWLTAQKIGRHLESYHNATSLTFGIQDGPEAGQTVPHVHIHIIPRKTGDFENNDDIYDEIDLKEKQLKRRLDDEERKDRSIEEMAQEAAEYRKLLS